MTQHSKSCNEDMEKVREISLHDEIQEGFTKEVTFKKLTVQIAKHRKANRNRWEMAGGKKRVAWALRPSLAPFDLSA